MGAMFRGGVLLLGAYGWLLVVSAMEAREERELVEALQEVLEKLRSRQAPSAQKKLGWVPQCDAGEECALRRGSRIGTLCSCPRGTVCDFTVLKCL